jgi:hypothetical protein
MTGMHHHTQLFVVVVEMRVSLTLPHHPELASDHNPDLCLPSSWDSRFETPLTLLKFLRN